MLVSVITTLYNYSKYIVDCINSVKHQNFDNYEMIIVDDCSTDNPYKHIKPLLSNTIHYIRLDSNMGYSHAKNVGIKNSSGEFLVMLDADDMLTSKSLNRRYTKIMEGFDLVHGPAINLNGKVESESPLWSQWLNSNKNQDCYRLIHAQSVMLKRSIHSEIGLYDTNLRYKSDREMWARIMNHKYVIGYTNKPVCYYRIHPLQMHKSKAKAKINDKLASELLCLIEKRKTDLSGLEML